MKNRLYLIAMAITLAGLGHAQNLDFVDNTNSAGLSSMQRAIDAENIPRMEGLMENGAGYYWVGGGDHHPLINYAISNNKPKAVEFLLSKQTVADYSTVLLAMEKTNYTLVKKLIEEKHLRSFRDTNMITESLEPTGRYSNVTELTSYEAYRTNWQLAYTLTNKKGIPQNYILEIGTNTYSNPQPAILQAMKAAKQKEGLASFSSNISAIITNTLSKTNIRKEEIFRLSAETNETNMLVSISLTEIQDRHNGYKRLARLAIGQDSLPMLIYFMDKGVSPKSAGLLHRAVALPNKEMVLYLLNKGADPLAELSSSYHMLSSSYYDDTEEGWREIELRYKYNGRDSGSTPFSMTLQRINYFDNSWILDMETSLRNLKDRIKKPYTYDSAQDIANYKADAASKEILIPTIKKNIPQWKEILNILKKYEE